MVISRKWKFLLTNVYTFTNVAAARSSFRVRTNAYFALMQTKNAQAGAYNEEDKLQIVQKSFVDGGFVPFASNTFCISKAVFSSLHLPFSSRFSNLSD